MGTRPVTAMRRWALKVELPTDPDGCWLWTGHRSADGYGNFKEETNTKSRAHRFGYERFVGPIPKGLTLDHLCRVRHCVNPAHLEAVTTAENSRRGYWAARTHCKRGHPLSGDNLGRDQSRSNSRFCRRCKADGTMRYRRSKQAREVKNDQP